MRQTLRPVRWTFFVFGAFWGTWAVAAADVERGSHLSAGGLGVVLSASVGTGGVLAVGVGGLAGRWGARRLLASTLVPWGVGSLAAATVGGRIAFLAVFALAMMLAGLVDMAMNTAAAAGLVGQPGRMVRFHALFNGGALAGAAATGGLLRAGLSWRWSWAVVGAGALVLAVVVQGAAIPGAPSSAGGGRSTFLRSVREVRAHGLVVLAVAFAAAAVVEGGIDTWGVLYLRTQLAAGVLLGAGAYALGQAVAVSTRGVGGPLIGRLGARRGLILGAATAAGGLALEAGTGHAAVAALGLLVAAGGISLCWPLVIASVAQASSPPQPAVRAAGVPAPSPLPGTPEPATALVGAFTGAGYMGWVVAPVIVGSVADAAGLAAGLFLLAGIAGATAGAVAVLPGRGRPR